MNDEFSKRGFLLRPKVVPPETCDTTLAAISAARGQSTGVSSNRRNLLRDIPLIVELARSEALISTFIHIEYASSDLPGGLEWYERPAT